MNILANVKHVSVKTLMSGDREMRIILSVVGDENIDNALEIAKLQPEDQVSIQEAE